MGVQLYNLSVQFYKEFCYKHREIYVVSYVRFAFIIIFCILHEYILYAF